VNHQVDVILLRVEFDPFGFGVTADVGHDVACEYAELVPIVVTWTDVILFADEAGDPGKASAGSRALGGPAVDPGCSRHWP
jgi:hypothetical protein